VVPALREQVLAGSPMALMTEYATPSATIADPSGQVADGGMSWDAYVAEAHFQLGLGLDALDVQAHVFTWRR
jgi:hypothetical protein